ncbi:glycoside hydrolase family 9 protein [candidate division KSB1 bacterium]|nr:glycoside hydrolase family 9 protein [candidate division KSB1 bacterium]
MPSPKLKIILSILIPVLLTGMLAAQEAIRLNQIGYYPKGPKFAVAVATTSNVFYLTSTDKADTVFTGALGAARIWSHSGETEKLIDFTAFQKTGKYMILVPDLGQSHPFFIKDYVHQDVSAASIKGYYFQRASTALNTPFAGKWNRPAGHLDTQVWVHVSAATTARPKNTIISSSKGWYDAGDYNKYIVNSGISTYSILAAYEHFPGYYRELQLNIPESGNNIPDILDEALWNINWMLTMQDPNDGGVYHKLTTANFRGMVMPHQDTARRYVVQKGTAATLDFAAVMAQASRIFQGFNAEMPGFAQTCLDAALNAWRWARRNPNVRYNQSALNTAYNPDINTGEYGDGNFTDEFRWAAAELFITTKADSFLSAYNPLSGSFGVPAWPNVNTLGLYSLVFHRAKLGRAVDTTFAISALLNLAGRLRNQVAISAYHVVMGESNNDFVWGSNGVAANQSMALIQAFKLTGDTSYLEAAVQNLDYMLGRNAVGYCFVTGYGSKPSMRIHHRQSQADGIVDPVPGLLAGGPNPRREDGCSGYIGSERARSYLDDVCSYASNEIAINWNAPLVYLAGAIEALYSPTGKPTGVKDDRNGTGPEGFGLLQNYPNPLSAQPYGRSPFNSSTQITYSLPSNGEVYLGVYNLSGQLVRTLQHTSLPSGQYTLVWNADTGTGTKVASGLYLVGLRLTANGRTWAEKSNLRKKGNNFGSRNVTHTEVKNL